MTNKPLHFAHTQMSTTGGKTYERLTPCKVIALGDEYSEIRPKGWTQGSKTVLTADIYREDEVKITGGKRITRELKGNDYDR